VELDEKKYKLKNLSITVIVMLRIVRLMCDLPLVISYPVRRHKRQ